VHRVIQQCDGPSEKSSEDLRNHQNQRRGHRPAEHSGFHRRVSVVVSVRVMMRMIMRVCC
jgi:hypothetical protein